ncbi:hypothetical protein FACS189479_04270 [Spirochaetia bacterium]|nr:hypothetical protein FACS189479_04270 [Spirochaetia bacterium]
MKKIFALLISAALIVSAISAQEAADSEAPAGESAAQEQSSAADQTAATPESDAGTEKAETTETPARAKIAAPGLKFSVGIGGVYTFLHYTYTRVDGKLDLATGSFEDVQWSGSENSGGVFAFFDATYAKLEFGYRGSQFGPLYIGLYGKYPFALIPKLTIAPTVGIDIDLLGSTYTSATLGIKAGASVDYELFSQLYVRGEALFDFDLGIAPRYTYIKDIYALGPQIKVSCGYTF